jgi:hypothetical protein
MRFVQCDDLPHGCLRKEDGETRIEHYTGRIYINDGISQINDDELAWTAD